MNHRFGDDTLLDDLPCDHGYDSWKQYINSKLMNVLFTVGIKYLCK